MMHQIKTSRVLPRMSGCPLGGMISMGVRGLLVKARLPALCTHTPDIYSMFRNVNKGHAKMLNIKHYQRWHELWCLMNLSFQLYYLFIKCILSYTQISDEWEEMQNVAPGYRGRSGLMLPSEHRRLWRWGNGFFDEFCILFRNAPEGITDFKANKGSLDCIIWLN